MGHHDSHGVNKEATTVTTSTPPPHPNKPRLPPSRARHSKVKEPPLRQGQTRPRVPSKLVVATGRVATTNNTSLNPVATRSRRTTEDFRINNQILPINNQILTEDNITILTIPTAPIPVSPVLVIPATLVLLLVGLGLQHPLVGRDKHRLRDDY